MLSGDVAAASQRQPSVRRVAAAIRVWEPHQVEFTFGTWHAVDTADYFVDRLEERRDRVIDYRTGELVAQGIPDEDAQLEAARWVDQVRPDLIRAIVAWRHTLGLCRRMMNANAYAPRKPRRAVRWRSCGAIIVARRGRARPRERRATRRTAARSSAAAGDPDSPGDQLARRRRWEVIGDEVRPYWADDRNAAHPDDGRLMPDE